MEVHGLADDINFEYRPEFEDKNFNHVLEIAADCNQLNGINPEKTNAIIDCMIISNKDHDHDGINDQKEMNKYWGHTLGPFVPDVWGYYSRPVECDYSSQNLYRDDDPWALS